MTLIIKCFNCWECCKQMRNIILDQI
jgi:hypothetical protein